VCSGIQEPQYVDEQKYLSTLSVQLASESQQVDEHSECAAGPAVTANGGDGCVHSKGMTIMRKCTIIVTFLKPLDHLHSKGVIIVRKRTARE
jgi:hypothetical protein